MTKSLRHLKLARGVTRVSAKDVREIMTGPKKHKYGAKRTVVDEIAFASKKEAKRYAVLRDCQLAGLLRDLKLQPRYPLVVNGKKIATYVGDFYYVDCETGEAILEDCKGFKTALYILKKKLFEALYDMQITEV